MNILLLSRYGRLGASSRVRLYQYLPYLEKEGMKVVAIPLFDNEYVSNLQLGKSKKPSIILKAYLNRLYWTIHYRHFDLVWIEKEILPWLPAWIEQLFFLHHMPYIVDYDDAIFHQYDMHHSRLIRFFLGRKIDRIMKCANAVICGNHYLEKRAKRAGAAWVEYLPSVVDTKRYHMIEYKPKTTFTIGWIGSPSTTEYLNLIIPALEDLCQDYTVRVVLVGSQKIESRNLNLTIRRWHERTEAEDIRDFDVGVMPLYHTPWTKGKCGYKLIQYMACGLPVVASPVEANLDIVQDGVNGYLVSGTNSWITALNRLKENAMLRWQMGKAGRRLVEEKLSLQITAPRLINILHRFNARK